MAKFNKERAKKEHQERIRRILNPPDRRGIVQRLLQTARNKGTKA